MSAPKLKRWEILPSTGSHFDMLDGLRGVAILLVVAFHALYVNPGYGLPAKMLNWIVIQSGWMGVPIFFVLSGFLISYPFFKGRIQNPHYWFQRGYFSRRLGKVLPPFYLSIILLMGFYWWQFHDPVYFVSGLKWACGLGGFISISPNFNGVYWSLIVELEFYFLLPLFFWLTRGLSVPRTAVVGFAAFILIPFVVRQMTWPQGVNELPDFTDPQNAVLTLKLTRFPCKLDYFAWGMLFAAVFVLVPKDREELKGLGCFGYVGATLLLITLYLWGVWTEQFSIKAHETQWSTEVTHLLPAAATMLILFFIFDRDCLGNRLLSLGGLRFAGIVSYEWFLFHGPFVSWFHDHFGASHGNVVAYAERTVLPLVLSFGFSVLVYRCFSLPILTHARERLRTAG